MLLFSESGTATVPWFSEFLTSFTADNCNRAMTSFPTFDLIWTLTELSLCGNDLETSDVEGQRMLHQIDYVIIFFVSLQVRQVSYIRSISRTCRCVTTS